MGNELESIDQLHASLLDATKQLSTQTILFHQHVAKNLGLNITDHKCLDFVVEMGRATAGQLAEWTGLTTGAITSVLNRLEKAGYIKRRKDPNDLRVVIVEPNYNQLHSLNEIFIPLAIEMEKLHQTYDKKELEVILDYLGKSRNILKQLTIHLKNKSKKEHASLSDSIKVK